MSREVFLNPGEYFAGPEGHRVHTILGSCVAIMLWSRGVRVGAMCHFLLPSRPDTEPQALDGRYGDEAVELMSRTLISLGVEPRDCEAKLFGGGEMFRPMGVGGLDIGRLNGLEARRLLQDRHITCVAESLFGEGHRKVVFDTTTGTVWSQQLALE